MSNAREYQVMTMKYIIMRVQIFSFGTEYEAWYQQSTTLFWHLESQASCCWPEKSLCSVKAFRNKAWNAMQVNWTATVVFYQIWPNPRLSSSVKNGADQHFDVNICLISRLFGRNKMWNMRSLLNWSSSLYIMIVYLLLPSME